MRRTNSPSLWPGIQPWHVEGPGSTCHAPETSRLGGWTSAAPGRLTNGGPEMGQSSLHSQSLPSTVLKYLPASRSPLSVSKNHFCAFPTVISLSKMDSVSMLTSIPIAKKHENSGPKRLNPGTNPPHGKGGEPLRSGSCIRSRLISLWRKRQQF